MIGMVTNLGRVKEGKYLNQVITLLYPTKPHPPTSQILITYHAQTHLPTSPTIPYPGYLSYPTLGSGAW